MLFWKTARKTTKKARIFYPCRTHKILGKEGQNAQKNKEFLEHQKSKEIQNSKEKKIRVSFKAQLGEPFLEILIIFFVFSAKPAFKWIKFAFVGADFWEGDATKRFSVKKGLFSEKGGGNSVNQGLGKDFYRKGDLVALYRAMRLRFGYGFESCDANGPRNVKNTYLAKHRPIFLPPLLLVGSKELVLKVSKRAQCHAAIRVTI